jgi:hypothetical protein
MKPFPFSPFIVSFLTITVSAQIETTTPQQLEPLVVTGKAQSLIGEAPSASKGQTNSEELLDRPYLRRGELLEAVPGVIITQHSGDGKANQYFVRGFNLDHGTDFSVSMDGQPVNFVTHAHGQGYADLNPIIRNSWKPSGLTYALEYNYYDGPWEREGNSQRLNGFLKYFRQSGQDTFSLTAMGYDGDWDSTDQIPKRLIASGEIDRLGSIDDTVRGESRRYSLMGAWDRDLSDGRLHADFHVGKYDLDLFSNFTRLSTELVGVEDIHLHPAEPRTFRVSFTRRF